MLFRLIYENIRTSLDVNDRFLETFSSYPGSDGCSEIGTLKFFRYIDVLTGIRYIEVSLYLRYMGVEKSGLEFIPYIDILRGIRYIGFLQYVVTHSAR